MKFTTELDLPAFMAICIYSVLGTTAAVAQATDLLPMSWPVSGVYTSADTKDMGKITGLAALDDIKIRGWIDTAYVYNFNTPNRSVVNNNQALSIVKGHNVSIEGRTFDIHSNSFQLSLAEVEIEKVPAYCGVGFKLDIAFGDTPDIIVNTIRGSLGPSVAADSVGDFDKAFLQASVSYIAPIGAGLRFDAGKFVTHIGGETIAAIKNWNYSHAYFFTYAIPFQDVGVRVRYDWQDIYAEFYALNGWNVTIDNNTGKTFGPSIGWTVNPWLALNMNYLWGPEQNNNDTNTRYIFDAQVALGPFDQWQFMLNVDYAYEQNAVNSNTAGAHWSGIAGYARYKINKWFEPSLRVEYYRDPQGFTTNVAQSLTGYTLTLNTLLGGNKSIALLLRPELRYDHSNAKFFTKNNTFRELQHQWTVGIGAICFF